MKRMDSHIRALQELMDSLTVAMIAEPIETITLSEDVSEARQIMGKRHFDVLGVNDCDGGIIGYVRADETRGGKVEDSYKCFSIDEIVSSDTPLKDCIQRVCEVGRFFVLGPNGIEGIVTVADLRKPPVCLMIFGVVSSLETALLAWICKKYPREEWKNMISEDRAKEAMKLHEERRKKNQEIGLADCLQLCDKATIFRKNDDMCPSAYGFQSKGEAKDFFNSLRTLRDNLAHSQDPTEGSDWLSVSELVNQAQEVLKQSLNILQQTP